MEAPTRSTRHYYLDGDLVLQVEATIFRVYSCTLSQTCLLFQGMLSHTSATIEGRSDATPIVIQGALAEDFNIFFDVLWANYGDYNSWEAANIGKLLKMAAFCICPQLVNEGVRLLKNIKSANAAEKLYIALKNDVPIARCQVFLRELLTQPIWTIPKNHLWVLGREFITILLEQRASIQRARFRATVTPRFHPDHSCEHPSVCKGIWRKMWRDHVAAALLVEPEPLEAVIDYIEAAASSDARSCECLMFSMDRNTKLEKEQSTVQFGVNILVEYFRE